ncbi:MAG: PTS fructose transporter subunit IIA [Pseudomonadota bacterium]
MMVALLLVTHLGVGSAICQTVEHIMGQSKISLQCIEVTEVPPAEQAIRQWMNKLTAGGLILTDLYGATPHNVAWRAVAATDAVRVLAGLNLPMVLRSLNYAHEADLATLYDIARVGARHGIQ